jgi:hypothetical protein
MYTEDAKVVVEKDIFVNIPMTKIAGKVRVKRRSFLLSMESLLLLVNT